MLTVGVYMTRFSFFSVMLVLGLSKPSVSLVGSFAHLNDREIPLNLPARHTTLVVSRGGRRGLGHSVPGEREWFHNKMRTQLSIHHNAKQIPSDTPH